MAIIYSTTPGHISATKNNGSPFILSLCRKLGQLAEKEHLTSIISHVVDEMKSLKIERYQRQITQVNSTLGVVYLGGKGKWIFMRN